METLVVVSESKVVRISLTQTAKNGKINASFCFSAKGENLSNFIETTCTKIVAIMELQQKIKDKGGKNNAFGLTKSGDFELNITTAKDGEITKELNNFVFALKHLGTENPIEVMKDLVTGYKLLTE